VRSERASHKRCEADETFLAASADFMGDMAYGVFISSALRIHVNRRVDLVAASSSCVMEVIP
jgi:hypothetical protein